MLWSSIKSRKVNTKTNKQNNKYLYKWIIQHPQVVHSPIDNDCLKFSIGGHSEPQLVSKMLLQVYVREFKNIILSPL